MATAARKVELTVGEVIEVDGKRYEVVTDRNGDLTLEPPITTMSELDRRWGTEPASQDEFDRLTADDPRDDEG